MSSERKKRHLPVKAASEQVATARCELVMKPRTLATIKAKKLPKGDIWPVAQVCAILASKKTSEMIPLYKPVFVKNVELSGELKRNGIALEAKVISAGAASADMEALVTVSVAALSIIDMCRSIQKSVEIRRLRLVNLPVVRAKRHKH